MRQRYQRHTRAGIVTIGLLALAAMLGSAPGDAAAADLGRVAPSLELIPADASLYSTMLHMREQVEAIRDSKAVAKIMQMPIVQMGLAQLKAEAERPGSFPAEALEVMKKPEVRELLALAEDMFSEEVFFYADDKLIGTVDLLQQTFGAFQSMPLMMAMQGGPSQFDEDMQLAVMLTMLGENLDLLELPNVVVGFKLSDKALAEKQLAKLEALATQAFAQVPELQGRFKRKKVGPGEYLVVELDAKMIPWDEIPTDRLEEFVERPGDVEKLLAKVKGMTLAVCLGIRGDYLLLSIGSSTDCLASLGQGDLLADRPEFEPVGRFSDQRITSIGYVSKAMMTQVSWNAEDIDALVELADGALPQLGLPVNLSIRIHDDVKKLADDLKRNIPTPGASLKFAFTTGDGQESYSYDWARPASRHTPEPLTLLNHLGGSPLAAYVSRSKTAPQSYAMAVKWIKIGWGYVEDFGLVQMPPPQRKDFNRVLGMVLPLVKRADVATREMLLPALEDGQGGIVLDAKLKSRQFIEALPPTPKPMPMLEPALIFGVSDAPLLREAVAEYWSIGNDTIKLIRKLNPDAPLDFKIPKPKTIETPVGTVYAYRFPKELGVDRRIALNAGLSDNVAVLSMSRPHTVRLLTETPLETPGVLDAETPLISAGVFDWAGLVDAATPWIELAARQIVLETTRRDDRKMMPDEKSDPAEPLPPADDNPRMAFVLDQVDTVLEVLKCLRRVTSRTYVEDGATVRHTVTEYRDLE